MADTDLLFPADDSTSEKPVKGPVLPANLEAEAAFLGAVLIDNKVIEELTTPLMPDHFFEPVHQRIYERVHKLLERNSVATPVTLKPYFESDEALKQLGGVTYLAQLTADGQGLLHPRELAEQIYDLALLRELVSVGRNLVEGALDTSDEVEPLRKIEQAEADLYRVAEGASTGNEAQSFRKAAFGALEVVQAAMNSGGRFSGKTTGLDTINDKTSGLHNSDLVILAGRPAMGKTSLATNIAFNAARRLMDDQKAGIETEKSPGAGVAFFSLEMSADQLATRILAEQAEISSEKLRWASSAAMNSSACLRQPGTDRPAALYRRHPRAHDRRAHACAAACDGTISGCRTSITCNCARAARATIASTKFRKSAAASRRWPRNCTFP